jgi:hypothetical protein
MLNVKNIRDLHNNKELWNKIKVFHYDLTTFGHNLESRKRLDHEPMAFCFMSSVYFTSSELEFLLKFPTPSGTISSSNLPGYTSSTNICGGGGGGYQNTTASNTLSAVSGTGGGGAGGYVYNNVVTAPTSATANTGGGGGGMAKGSTIPVSGSGGSGIVIITYR